MYSFKKNNNNTKNPATQSKTARKNKNLPNERERERSLKVGKNMDWIRDGKGWKQLGWCGTIRE